VSYLRCEVKLDPRDARRLRWQTVETARASVGRGIGDGTAAVTPEAIGPPCFTGSCGFQVGFGQEVQNPTNRQAIDGEPAGAENP
jgi:hypothetical protein